MTLSGQTKRDDMTSGNLDLFKMALGLEDPWKVTRTDFNPEGGRLDLYLDFHRGARFSGPVDGCGQKACPVRDAEDRQWRHLDVFQHEAYMHARLPRVRCHEHGVHQVNVSWARPGSGFTLLFEALLITFATAMPVAKAVSYTHLRAHETPEHLVCRLLLEKKNKNKSTNTSTPFTSIKYKTKNNKNKKK